MGLVPVHMLRLRMRVLYWNYADRRYRGDSGQPWTNNTAWDTCNKEAESMSLTPGHQLPCDGAALLDGAPALRTRSIAPTLRFPSY